jgi:hypothetical protein
VLGAAPVLRRVKLQDCPHPFHPLAGLEAARTLVMLAKAQLDDGRLVLKDAGMAFGELDVIMTPEQFIMFALNAINTAMKRRDVTGLNEPKQKPGAPAASAN